MEIWDELKPEGSKQELFKRLSKLGPEATRTLRGARALPDPGDQRHHGSPGRPPDRPEEDAASPGSR